MELTPRLQDIINILKEKGELNIKDLALELKVSPKTAKGYIRELSRLGFVEEDKDGNVKLKAQEEKYDSNEIKKIIEMHENEIANLKKKIEEIEQEIDSLKKKGKVK